MSTLAWIVGSGVAMTAISLVGGVTLLIGPDRLQRLVLPLVALSAGSLIGGAFFHMIPSALGRSDDVRVFAWVAVGFALFFALEQALHYHHCHRGDTACARRPLSYLVLIGDGLHNLLGGLALLLGIRLAFE